MSTPILFFLTFVLSSFTQSFIGFGLGIVAIAIMPYFMPHIQTDVAISSFLSTGTSGMNAIAYRKYVNPRRVLTLLVFYMITSTIVIVAFKNFNSSILKRVLGLFLMLYSIAALLGWLDKKISPSLRNSAIAGMLSGILGGLFGTGGPPIAVYLMQSSDDHRSYYADIQCYFTLANIYSTIVRLVNGQITQNVLIYVLIGIPAVLIGTVTGRKLQEKMDGKRLKKYLYYFLIINGILMLVSR